MFAQRRNRLKTHFSERISVVKRRISVLPKRSAPSCGQWTRSWTNFIELLSSKSVSINLSELAYWQGLLVLDSLSQTILCPRFAQMSIKEGRADPALGDHLYVQSIRRYTGGGRNSAIGIATPYGLDGPGIESQWGRDFPHPSILHLGPTPPPI